MFFSSSKLVNAKKNHLLLFPAKSMYHISKVAKVRFHQLRSICHLTRRCCCKALTVGLKHTTLLIYLVSIRFNSSERAPSSQPKIYNACRAARGNLFQELTAVHPMMFRHIQGRSVGNLSHTRYTPCQLGRKIPARYRKCRV